MHEQIIELAGKKLAGLANKLIGRFGVRVGINMLLATAIQAIETHHTREDAVAFLREAAQLIDEDDAELPQSPSIGRA